MTRVIQERQTIEYDLELDDLPQPLNLFDQVTANQVRPAIIPAGKIAMVIYTHECLHWSCRKVYSALVKFYEIPKL